MCNLNTPIKLTQEVYISMDLKMESDNEILGSSSRGRYSTMDVAEKHRDSDFMSQHHSTMPNQPQRSRSMINLSSSHSFKRHSWLLPESRTVAEKQSQLTRRKGLSGALSPPPPKTPSVKRYLEIFNKLKAAYSGFLRSWEDVNRSLLSSKENVLYDKIKKKLVAKLQKIGDLNDLYIHQEHMRKGAQNLLNTIERETSKKVKSGKDYCKMNLKKNITRLCDVENEINDMAGSMRIHIVGLIGFARLSPGDVYSVQLKHGYDKLHSKCKVVGQGQKWTNLELSIKINPANDLVLKVSEVRKVNMNAVGEVTCPIANFLSSDGQEFVLPVNSTGTLKLKISAFWNPFASKLETALYEKLNISEVPKRLDSLSDSSLTPSPCSTPKNGTFSSMPSLMTKNGTLTSMKISVNGTFLSPEASVIKHSKVDNGTDKIDGNSKSLLMVKSLPNIVKSCEDETVNREQLEVGITERNPSNNNNKEKSELFHASSHGVLNDKVVLRDSDLRGKKQLRPVTVNPTFTNGISYQSDYENVVHLINTSILGEKPDVIPEEGKKPKSKQRPKSVAVPYKPVPIPDYPVDFRLDSKSSELSRIKSVPVIDEPDYSPPPQPSTPSFRPFPPPPVEPAPSPPVTPKSGENDTPETPISTSKSLEICSNCGIEGLEKNSKNTSSKATLYNSEAKKVDSNAIIVSTATTVNAVTVLNDVNVEEVDGEDDDLLRGIRSSLLDSLVKCNQFTEELEDRSTSLKNVLEDISILLQEKKKPLSRTSSIENALISIDSAFDFLSEHQTLKPDKETERIDKEICADSWKILKKVLRHHLNAVRSLIEKLLSLESPLGVKRAMYLEQLLAQAEVLRVICNSLTSDDTVTPKSVASHIDKTKLSGIMWEKHCSKEELMCTKEHMTLVLNQIYSQFHPGKTQSNEVCEEVLKRMQDMNVYGKDSESISLFQFTLFISRIKNLSEYLDTVSKEKKVQKAFEASDDLLIMSMMQDWHSIPVVPNVLKMIASLFNAENKTIQSVTVAFLMKLPMNTKKQAIDIYLEMVEDDDATLRASVCTALKCLEASKAQQTIAYLWKNDVESVRKAAFEALEVIGFPAGMEPVDANKKLQTSEVSTKF